MLKRWCESLCKNKKKSHKKKDKKDKKEKHNKTDEQNKNKHKVKNVYTFSMTGQGKKNVEQDTYCVFEL